MITLLGALIQVEFQSKSSSPFDTHYWIMSTFLVALSTYVWAWARLTIEVQVENHNNHNGVMSKISHLSGALAPVLLMLIILPLLGWVTFVFWAICFVRSTYELIEYAFYLLLDKLKKEEEEELPV